MMKIQILIDNRSGRPIYEQLYEQIKAQIISGALEEDEALPSIRNLAKDLKISVITTKRAYEELESEGFIYTLAGKGSYVARKNTELLREENLRKIEEHLEKALELGLSCGVGRDEIKEMLDILAGDNDERD